MYSFNFDYIFNVVYNILLAIRYAILFWILKINPSDYVMDHKYDSYDGLIARGWISGDSNPISPTNTIYLGNSDSSVGLWQKLLDKIFPNSDFTANQLSHDSLFSNLKFSIQNPILSFLSDIVSVIAFFAMMFLIWQMFVWFLRTTKSLREKNEKAVLEKRANKKSEREKFWIEENEKQEKEIEKIEELKVINLPNDIDHFTKEEQDFIPAGIVGLPIDESDLFSKEKEEIKIIEEKENSLLLNYVPKNDLRKSKDRVIKITTKEEMEEISKNEDRLNNEKKLEEVNKNIEYKERWNIIINYMEGDNDALWRIGLLEADNLLSDLLEDRGYQGITLADKLKNASFGTIDLAWSAHKMRNRIAHDGSKFVLTDRMARNTLELFRSVFTEFKIFE